MFIYELHFNLILNPKSLPTSARLNCQVVGWWVGGCAIYIDAVSPRFSKSEKYALSIHAMFSSVNLKLVLFSIFHFKQTNLIKSNYHLCLCYLARFLYDSRNSPLRVSCTGSCRVEFDYKKCMRTPRGSQLILFVLQETRNGLFRESMIDSPTVGSEVL